MLVFELLVFETKLQCCCSIFIYICLLCQFNDAFVDNYCLQSASKSSNKDSKDSKSSKDKEDKKDAKDVGDGAHVDAVSIFVYTF